MSQKKKELKNLYGMRRGRVHIKDSKLDLIKKQCSINSKPRTDIRSNRIKH